MSLCYLLSSTIAKPLVEHYFSRRLTQLRAQLATWRGDTAGDDGRSASSMSGSFFLILFLRMTPFVPNWFVSLSAPVVGFPYPAFLAASLLGIIPANYVHCATGRIIKELALQEQASSATGAGSPSSSSGGSTWALVERWGPYAALFALQFIGEEETEGEGGRRCCGRSLRTGGGGPVCRPYLVPLPPPAALLPVLLQSRISRAIAARKSAAESSPSSSSFSAPQAPPAAPILAVGSDDAEKVPAETIATVGILPPHVAPAPPDQQRQEGGALKGPGRPVPRRQSRSRSRGPAPPAAAAASPSAARRGAATAASPTAAGGVGRLRRSLRSKTPEPRQPVSQQRRQAHRA